MLKTITATLAAAALVAGATGAVAQVGEELIAQQLARAVEAFANNGMQGVLQLNGRMSLAEGGTGATSIRLDTAGSYVVLGVCDEDCSNFDLTVRSEDGSEMGSDVLDDDAPVVAFDAEAGALYEITGSMVACQRAPCLAGVAVYRAG
ncbi:MAG: hypothetical protein EON89_10480 [Brevundimonas sp.]|nr:MAG: hypothetical protein EON89_10480 [Brevundimonas sp.]